MAGDADRTAEELEQMTMNAIETAMASSEQTYEQFLQCFTHLTAGWLWMAAQPKCFTCLTPGWLWMAAQPKCFTCLTPGWLWMAA